MVSSISTDLPSDIQGLVAQAIQVGRLSRRDHLTLSAAMLSHPSLSTAARHQINQVFDLIRMGQVQIKN